MVEADHEPQLAQSPERHQPLRRGHLIRVPPLGKLVFVHRLGVVARIVLLPFVVGQAPPSDGETQVDLLLGDVRVLGP